MVKRMLVVEDVLKKAGEDHVVERVCALQKLREEKADLSFYQIKCESLLFSYSDDSLEDTESVDEDISVDGDSESLSADLIIAQRVI